MIYHICKSIFVAIILLSNQLGYSQQIEFDFQNKIWKETRPSLSKGDFYKIKITGINQNLYSIRINKKDSTVPMVSSFPSFDMLSMDAINTAISGLSGLFTSVPAISKFKEALYKKGQAELFIDIKNGRRVDKSFKLNKERDSTIQKYKILDSALIHMDIDSLFNERDNYDQILTNEFSKYSRSDQISAKILETNSQLIEFLNYIKLINVSIDELNHNSNMLRLSYLIPCKNQPDYKILQNSISFEQIIELVGYLRNEIKHTLDMILITQNHYLKFAQENNETIDSSKILKENHQKLIDAFKAGIETSNKIQETINADKVMVLLETLLHMENTSSFEYYSMPIEYLGDINVLELWIEPRDDKYRLQKYYTSYSFPINYRYSGISISFYHSWLKNFTYSTKEILIDTIKQYNLIDEEHSRGEIGIAALLHFGKKIGKTDWGAHGTIGPALSVTNTIKPRLAIGGGMSYGKKQMVTLDLLYMAGYVDELSKAIDINSTYLSKPDNIVISKLRGSWSISIGYIHKF